MAKKKEDEKKARRTSAANKDKYEYALLLYLNCTPAKDIAEKVGVSPNTITRWKNDNGWESKRISTEYTTDALIAKTMKKANELLESKDFSADAYSKTIAQLKSLKKNETSVDDVMNSLTKFGDWLIEKAKTDKRVTTDLIKIIIEYQDEYIKWRISNG